MQLSSACSRVFSTTKLARNIFFSLGRGDACSAAYVCRAWAPAANDVVWSKLNSLTPLLRLLVPFKDDTGEFVQNPTQEDWKSIEKYTHRVQELEVGTDPRFPPPSESVFLAITQSCTSLGILPKMWKLRWFAHPSYAVIFLHGGIRRLELLMDFKHPAEMRSLLSSATGISTKLTTLNLCTDRRKSHPRSVKPFENELCTYLKNLQDLKTLRLPMHWLTSSIGRVLGQLPRLDFVWFKRLLGDYGHPLDTMSFKPIDAHNTSSFPYLTQLHQSTPFAEIIEFLSVWTNSSRLTNLAVTSQILETPDSYHFALAAVADQCPSLSVLRMTSLTTPYCLPSRSSQHRITLETLRPLQRLGCLRSIGIHHTLPLALSDEDFKVLIAGWSRIKILSFGCDPYLLEGSDIRTARCTLPNLDNSDEEFPVMGVFKSIQSLRKYCPGLRKIEIYGVDDFSTVEGTEDEAQPFPNLCDLSFGTTHITSEAIVVCKLLSRYVLPKIQFHSMKKYWGGDEHSHGLIYLNFHPMRPFYDVLEPYYRRLLDRREIGGAPSEPVGIMGICPFESYELDEYFAEAHHDLGGKLQWAVKIRQDEQARMKKRSGTAILATHYP